METRQSAGWALPQAILGIAMIWQPVCTNAAEADSVFHLGVVQVHADRAESGGLSGDRVSSLVTADEMARFNRETLGEALNLLSGVSVSTNARNEVSVYLRGYDPRQVPLFIDGVPVYVPYDGYADFGRFDTAEIAVIQVVKGFSSMAFGPNTLGGAINAVSRKPAEALEAYALAGVGGDDRRRGIARVGTDQGNWYAHAGVARRSADGFRLSSDFDPTPTENGGTRNNSDYEDTTLSLRLGLTPVGHDGEYAVTYYSVDGEKGQPPTTGTAGVRFWRWPQWDNDSISFTSRTALSETEAVRLRLYRSEFKNEVNSFTDGTYTTLRTSGPGSVSTGISIYDDEMTGGMLHLETRRLSGHGISLYVHYKDDEHSARDGDAVNDTDVRDVTRSIALEDEIALRPDTRLVVGYAYHELDPKRVFRLGNDFSLPGKTDAADFQAGLFHDLDSRTLLYASAARKTRLPSLKDRYSVRLGRYVENPDLGKETAVNLEIGFRKQGESGLTFEAAIFQNETVDKIQEVLLIPGSTSCTDTTPCQMQNIGETRARGIELGIRTRVGSQFELGGNATFMDLENLDDSNRKMLDVPDTKFTAFGIWYPSDQIELVAFAEYDDGRWVSDNVKLDSFTTGNLKAAWRISSQWSAEVAVNNVTDKDYESADGFPAPGRTWASNMEYRFR